MYKVQVESSHYGCYYDNKERYYSYIEQMSNILRICSGSVVEIGKGSGFVSREISRLGCKIQTVDFDASLRPDIVASVEALPFPVNYCDMISCCEVLEHLPFDKFIACLKEIARVTRRDALISLPNSSSVLCAGVSRGWLKRREMRVVLSGVTLRRPVEHVFDGQHYWEIGKRGYSLAVIKAAMIEAGFDIVRDYRFHLNPYHHFFILQKKQPV